MSLRRVIAMLSRLVQELHRDRRSMALLFVAPVVLTGLMAFVLRGQQVAPVAGDGPFPSIRKAGHSSSILILCGPPFPSRCWLNS